MRNGPYHYKLLGIMLVVIHAISLAALVAVLSFGVSVAAVCALILRVYVTVFVFAIVAIGGFLSSAPTILPSYKRAN